MTWISSAIKELAIFMLIANILSTIVPTENYKKHFRIITGIVLIIIIIQPLSKAFGNNNLVNMFQEKYMLSEVTELNKSLGNVNKEICDKSIQSYENEFNNKIKKVLSDEKISVKSVSTEITYSDDTNEMVIQKVDISLGNPNKDESIAVNEVRIGTNHNQTQDVKTMYIVSILEKYGIKKEVISIS